MAGTNVTKQKDADASLAKGFRGYKPMKEKPVRQVEMVEDETLKKLKGAWKTVKYDGNLDVTGLYKQVLRAIEGLSHSASDVENFSIVLAEFQEERGFKGKAGMFMSALVNTCNDKEFVIHTSHITEPINYLGYESRKDIIVEGDVGDNAGWAMEGGTITVKGNANHLVGCSMNAGVVIVEGNAAANVGHSVRGGSIVVKGNAGAQIGEWMVGGEIHLESGYESIGYIERGKIFHKGVLIAKK
ncbi:MAG: hypothetical protein PHF60_03060 [Candidatus ainarchaeum sp.]|nr:hypothetical protein [Candidatus ainarchaeum sp.]